MYRQVFSIRCPYFFWGRQPSLTTSGEEGSELFFIESGTVSVRVGIEEREITTLSQGQR